jgi:hypothetical protein
MSTRKVSATTFSPKVCVTSSQPAPPIRPKTQTHTLLLPGGKIDKELPIINGFSFVGEDEHVQALNRPTAMKENKVSVPVSLSPKITFFLIGGYTFKGPVHRGRFDCQDPVVIYPPPRRSPRHPVPRPCLQSPQSCTHTPFLSYLVP